MPAPYYTPKAARLAEVLDAELEAEVTDALETDADLEGLTTAQLRDRAYDATREFRHADAARFLRAAIARYPDNPKVSALAAADLAGLRERLETAERLATREGA